MAGSSNELPNPSEAFLQYFRTLTNPRVSSTAVGYDIGKRITNESLESSYGRAVGSAVIGTVMTVVGGIKDAGSVILNRGSLPETDVSKIYKPAAPK
ncbi:MAG: hypothetical protein SFW65_08280 [Alphaproteobacteria bacterium]|nr:hypothetical protein [Alphaproteobacteria bacterium]